MIAIESDTAACQSCYVLRPNRSLSWRQNLGVFCGLSLVTLMLVFPLVAMGFWLVLPFAGLELLAVGAGLYYVSCCCHECEVICVATDSIQIERGRWHSRQRWVLARQWVRVVLTSCPRQWYPSRLHIRTQGRTVEIGRFLVERERRELAQELTRRLHIYP